MRIRRRITGRHIIMAYSNFSIYQPHELLIFIDMESKTYKKN